MCVCVCFQHYTKDADGLCTRLIKPKLMEGTVAAQDEFSRSESHNIYDYKDYKCKMKLSRPLKLNLKMQTEVCGSAVWIIHCKSRKRCEAFHCLCSSQADGL